MVRQSVKVGQFAIIRNGIKQYFRSLDKGRIAVYVYAEDDLFVRHWANNIGDSPLFALEFWLDILMMISESQSTI